MAAVAEIVCWDGTELLTPVVRAQPDGVHLRVDNRTGAERYIYEQADPTSALNQHQAPPGISEAVSIEGPGSWRVICSPPSLYPGEDSPWVELEVADPEGIWVPDEPACQLTENTHPDYVEELPKGEAGDPLELAKRELPEWMPGSRPGDVVEPAGYPQADPPQFRIMRGGQVVAVAYYRHDGREGWLFGGIDYCADETQGQPEPPD